MDLNTPSEDSSQSSVEFVTKKTTVESREPKDELKNQPSKNHGAIFRIIHVIWASKYTTDSRDPKLLAKLALRQVVIYSFFLTIVSIIAFGTVTPAQYNFTSGLQGQFLNKDISDADGAQFPQIADNFQMWEFLLGNFLRFSLPIVEYNGNPVVHSGYLINDAKLLGGIRLRQVVVRNDSCTIASQMASSFSNCYAPYSSSAEETSPLSPSNTPLSATLSAYQYQTEQQLQTRPYWGKVSTYGGGGYALTLPIDNNLATKYITDLQNNLWINHGTRALFIDMTVYNANVNLFCIIKFIIEFPATGAIIPTSLFTTVKLLRTESTLDKVILGFQIIFLCFIFYYLIEELLECYHVGIFKYLRSIWSWLDMIIISLSIVAFIVNIYSFNQVHQHLQALAQNPNQFVSFDNISYWQQQYNLISALVVFFSWLKLFKFSAFNRTLTKLTKTLLYSSKGMIGFLFIFALVFCSYAMLGTLLFGSLLFDFSSFSQSIFTLFRILLGDFQFLPIEFSNRILGPIYFVSFVFLVFFVMMSMFIAIVNDSYKVISTSSSINDQTHGAIVAEMMKGSWNWFLAKIKIDRADVKAVESAIAAADVNKDGKVTFEDLKAKMIEVGRTQDEIQEIFSRYDLDGNQILDHEEQFMMIADLQLLDEELREKEENAKMASMIGGGNANIAAASPAIVQFIELKKRIAQLELALGSITTKVDALLSQFGVAPPAPVAAPADIFDPFSLDRRATRPPTLAEGSFV